MIHKSPSHPPTAPASPPLVQQYLTTQGQAVTAYKADIDDSIACLHGLSNRDRERIEEKQGK
ncbi:hypothetical protein [Trichothermofontia sp.]